MKFQSLREKSESVKAEGKKAAAKQTFSFTRYTNDETSSTGTKFQSLSRKSERVKAEGKKAAAKQTF